MAKVNATELIEHLLKYGPVLGSGGWMAKYISWPDGRLLVGPHTGKLLKDLLLEQE